MRPRKIDSNQNQIVEALRKMGVSVYVTSMVGKGFPDIIVGVRKRNWLIELKNGDKSESRRKLTPSEKEFFLTWQGSVEVCKNLDEVLELIGMQ